MYFVALGIGGCCELRNANPVAVGIAAGYAHQPHAAFARIIYGNHRAGHDGGRVKRAAVEQGIHVRTLAPRAARACTAEIHLVFGFGIGSQRRAEGNGVDFPILIAFTLQAGKRGGEIRTQRFNDLFPGYLRVGAILQRRALRNANPVPVGIAAGYADHPHVRLRRRS